MNDAQKEFFLHRLLRSAVRQGDCWKWSGAKTPPGYGKLWVNGRCIYAHRLSYVIFKGTINNGREIDHLCKNKSCINPDHLEVVAHIVNLERAMVPTIINRLKTHCIRGHEFTENNTRRIGHWRICRECCRLRRRNFRTKCASCGAPIHRGNCPGGRR